MTIVFVGNIDRRITETNVRSVFEVYGPVANVNVKSGTAFVEMTDDKQAQNAISELDKLSSWVVRMMAVAA